MAELKMPVRYYKDYQGGYDYGYEDLTLPLDTCAFLLVDVHAASGMGNQDTFCRRIQPTCVSPLHLRRGGRPELPSHLAARLFQRGRDRVS